MSQEKKKFKWNYALHGVSTLLPLYVTKIATTEEEARAEILAELGERGILFDPPEISKDDGNPPTFVETLTSLGF